MSVNTKEITTGKVESLNTAAIRYAIGSTLIMSIAMAFAWNLSYLTPVLALSFMGPGSNQLGFKQGIGFIIVISVSTFSAFIFSKYFLDKVGVFIPMLGLVLYYTFYSNKLKGPVKIFMLISFLLLPILSMQHIAVAYYFNLSFIFGATLTVLLIWIVYTIFPTKETNQKTEEKPSSNSPNEQRSKAIQTFIVVFPIVLLFFTFNWSGALLVLIFIGILSMNPDFNAKAGFALVAGNFAGGLLAIVAFELFVMVPHFVFFILIILGVSLAMAPKIFSKKKTAPLFGMAYSTFLLIIGQSVTSTSDAGGKVWIRVLQIMIAVIYVIIALKVLDAYKSYRTSKNKLPDPQL